MNTTELDRLFQQVARKIVSAEITDGPGPLPHGVFEQAPRVIATLETAAGSSGFRFTQTNDRSVRRNSSA